MLTDEVEGDRILLLAGRSWKVTCSTGSVARYTSGDDDPQQGKWGVDPEEPEHHLISPAECDVSCSVLNLPGCN